MVPTSLTVSAILASATTVVTEFGSLIVLIAALIVGIFGVRFVIRQVRKAL